MPMLRKIMLGAVLTSALVPAAAGAALTTDTACATANDPIGDAFIGFAGNYSPLAADGNQDISGITFTHHVTTDGDESLTATLYVPGLNTTAPPASLGLVYRLLYTDSSGLQHYYDTTVDAVTDTNVSFSYGHFDTTKGGLVSDGTGSGVFTAGPDGSITVNMPSDIDPSDEISDITWNASTDRGLVIAQSDVVPDTGGLSYDGSTCPVVTDPPADDE